ncbi:tyrosine-type recombinase/integrase [Candidatus Berkelbacteria bacterium]|nr:tyrosine-type recombinase/integrase [Candidatus Berkelbacteria bacterium]
MKISRAIKEFLRHNTVSKGYSPLTLRNYTMYLARFQTWCDQNNLENVTQITAEDVEEFQMYLRGSERSPSPKTQNYYLIAIRSLLKYLAKKDVEGVLSSEKITLAKTASRQVIFVENDEIEKIRSVVDTSTTSGKRDLAIISILFSTGLRIAELVKLKREQVIAKSEFSIKGKGGKVRPVFLTERAQKDLKNYLLSRKDSNSYLFIRHHRKPELDNAVKPLTARTIQRLITVYAKACDINKPVTPHKLRHGFATELLRSGADLRSVQALLGHSSITTTQAYTHVTDRSLREAHKKFHSDNTPKEPASS